VPSCEATTSGQVLEGDTLIFTCSMDFYCKSPIARKDPGAGITASIDWEPNAWTFLGNSSTDLTNEDGDFVGMKLQVSRTGNGWMGQLDKTVILELDGSRAVVYSLCLDSKHLEALFAVFCCLVLASASSFLRRPRRLLLEFSSK